MYSERVTHLGLVCSRLRADAPETASARLELADRIERESSIEPVIDAYLQRLFAPETFARDADLVERVREIARGIDPRGAAAMLRGMAARVASDDIAGDLEMPMLMVAGGRDAVISMEEARGIARAFPDGRLIACERSGHLPMLEEPMAVTAALEDFLSGRLGAATA